MAEKTEKVSEDEAYDPVTGAYYDRETGELLSEGRLNDAGQETLDPRPMEIPAGFKRPETTAEIIQRLVRREVSEAASAGGHETFEEASDFEVEDDEVLPDTPYEAVFDPILGRDVTPAEFSENQAAYLRLYEAGVKDVSQEELRAALVSEFGEDRVSEAERSLSVGEQDRRAPVAPDQASAVVAKALQPDLAEDAAAAKKRD